jgi:hypothetical protein
LRDYIPRIHGAGGELVILGNGTPQQAAWFVEDYHIATPVVTDPGLVSHRIVGAKKPKFLDPRTLLASVRAFRQGFRQTRTMGSAMQLGGVFVITPRGEMPYRYLSEYAGDHPPPEEAVAALERATAA